MNNETASEPGTGATPAFRRWRLARTIGGAALLGVGWVLFIVPGSELLMLAGLKLLE